MFLLFRSSLKWVKIESPKEFYPVSIFYLLNRLETLRILYNFNNYIEWYDIS